MEEPTLPKVIQPNFTESELEFLAACFSHSLNAAQGDMVGTLMSFHAVTYLIHHNEEMVAALSRKLLTLI